jgi:hypothetical protein
MKALDEIRARLTALEKRIENLCNRTNPPLSLPEKIYFRKGEWVRHIGTGRIFKIDIINGDFIRSEGMGLNYEAINCVPAEKKEIEAHLKGICDEKYLGKSIKGLNGRISEIKSTYAYCTSGDEFYFYSDFDEAVLLYKEGNWADGTTVKRVFPRTREELKILHREFCSFRGQLPWDEYIDKYYS